MENQALIINYINVETGSLIQSYTCGPYLKYKPLAQPEE